MDMINRRWCLGSLAKAPPGFWLGREQFVYSEAEVPEIGDGQILVHSECLGPDPMVHAWARGVMPGLPGFAPMREGEPLRGMVGGVIVKSRNAQYKVGDRITGALDWADYSVSNGMDYLGLPLECFSEDVSFHSALGTLGMNGLCAYFGLFDYGRPIPGETVLVSGASGAIGSVAVQLAKLAGARVVGLAGGPEKCHLLEQLGVDVALDYKSGDLCSQVASACPDGIDVFFDNVGGEILDIALLNINKGGRIVVCGVMAHFSQTSSSIQHHVMLAGRGATMAGFYYYDFVLRWPTARKRLKTFLDNGRIKELFDIEKGFEAVPAAAISQFTGTSGGRKIIDL